MAESLEFRYPGSELALFAGALNWKHYLRRQLRPYIRGRVAEVGAGLGSFTRVFAELDYTSWLALEPDRELASQIPASPRVRVSIGTIEDLDRSDRFDLIMYIDVLEHLEDDRAEMRQACEHLASGGHVAVLAPAHNYLFTEFDRAIGHHRRYNKRTLRASAPSALRLRQLRYLDSVGMLASLANRLLLRQSMPTVAQIAFWNRVMVPCSTVMDVLTGYSLGKSVLGIWEKPA